MTLRNKPDVIEGMLPNAAIEELKDASIADILAVILAHRARYPRHGTNCSCMDKYSWVIRAQIRQVIDKPHHEQTKTEQDAMWSFSHVLQMIVRNL